MIDNEDDWTTEYGSVVMTRDARKRIFETPAPEDRRCGKSSTTSTEIGSECYLDKEHYLNDVPHTGHIPATDDFGAGTITWGDEHSMRYYYRALGRNLNDIIKGAKNK